MDGQVNLIGDPPHMDATRADCQSTNQRDSSKYSTGVLSADMECHSSSENNFNDVTSWLADKCSLSDSCQFNDVMNSKYPASCLNGFPANSDYGTNEHCVQFPSSGSSNCDSAVDWDNSEYTDSVTSADSLKALLGNYDSVAEYVASNGTCAKSDSCGTGSLSGDSAIDVDHRYITDSLENATSTDSLLETNKQGTDIDSSYTYSSSCDSAVVLDTLDWSRSGENVDCLEDSPLKNSTTGANCDETLPQQLETANETGDAYDVAIDPLLVEDMEQRERKHTMSPLFAGSFASAISCSTPDLSQLAQACRKAYLTLDKKDLPHSLSLLPQKQPLNDVTVEIVEDKDTGDICRPMKNLIVLSIVSLLYFLAIGSLRNLQSSLNQEGGMGLYSLAVAYAAFMLGSLFTPFIVRQTKPKTCIVWSLLTQLIYVLANIYPKFYIFIPASALQGFGHAVLWNGLSCYVTLLSKSSAETTGDSLEQVSSKYFGIYFLIFQWSCVLGNLISSIVLMVGAPDYPADSANNVTWSAAMTNGSLLSTSSMHSTGNDTFQKLNYSITSAWNSLSNVSDVADDYPTHYHLCGAKYCHSYTIDHAGMKVDLETKYILLGIYSGCVLGAIATVIVFLDPLKSFRATRMSCQMICSQMASVCKIMANKKFLLVLFLNIYSLMQYGFVTAEVTKAYITCPVGIYMVGYSMICYGLTDALSSFTSGWLNKIIGRVALLSSVCIIDMILLILMLLWKPTPDHLWPYFLLMGAWGLGDGILISQTSSLISTMFPERCEESFAAVRILQGLALVVNFAYSESLCMESKIYITGAVCLLGTGLYLVMEIDSKRSKRSEDKNTKP